MVFISISGSVSAQFAMEPIVFPSPDASSIAKFTDVPVDLYSGIPDLSIPLTSIKGKNLGLDFVLRYHAGGIKVNEVPGWVGSGWSLNLGGVITRVTQGLPDDEQGKGFYFSGDELISEWPHPSATYLQELRSRQVDGMPDMFYYNFNGKSGKFYFDNNGEIQTFPYDNVDIELLEIGTKSNFFGSLGNVNTYGFKKWQIKDEFGNKYIFDEIEVAKSSSSFTNGPSTGGDLSYSNSAWYLSKIISANGDEEINYHYRSDIFQHYVNFSEFQSIAIGDYTGTLAGSQVYGGLPSSKSETTTFTYSRIIDKISFKNGNINFGVSARNDLVHSKDNTSYDNYKLDSITLTDLNDNLKRKIELVYEDVSNQRLTLLEIVKGEEGRFSFDYYNMNQLPEYTSKRVDHWGLYNGANNYGANIIPTFSYSYSTYQDQTYNGINKEPNNDKMKFGTLNKVTRPTGGYTKFYFEPNDYSYTNNKPLSEDSWSAWTTVDSRTTTTLTFPQLAQVEIWYECTTDGNVFDNSLEPCNSVLSPHKFNHIGELSLQSYIPPSYGNPVEVIAFLRYRTLMPASVNKKTTGGLRVAKIEHVEGGGAPLVKEYTYEEPGIPGISSGVIGTEYTNYVQFFTSNTYFNANGIKAYSHSAFPISTSKGNHIVYKNVEVKTEGNGSELNSFTSFYDFPDIRGIQTNNYDMPMVSKKSYDFKRGLLREKITYNDAGDVVSNYIVTGTKEKFHDGFGTNVYDYQNFITFNVSVTDPNGGTTNVIEVTLSESSAYTIESPSFRVTSEKNERNKNSFTPLIVSNSYRFNNYDQLNKKEIWNSKGELISTLYKYPKDYSQPSTVISQMITDNIVGIPVEEIVQVDNMAIQGKALEFTTHNSGIVLEKVNYLESDIPISNFSFSNDGNTFHSNFEEKVDKEYDQNFNLINEVENSGAFSSYLWDYNHSIPIAKVLNSENSEIFYTSFETTEKGGWSYSGSGTTSTNSRTGDKIYHLGSGAVTKSSYGASSGDPFLLSFWVRRSSGSGNWTVMGKTVNVTATWQLVSLEVAGGTITIPATSGIYIDELRLHPADSQMSTYTYDPLVGMTSQTDARNYTTYYEYDDFGRLKTIRDEDGKVLEHYEYNYANQ